MYCKAEFFQMKYPLKIEENKSRFSKIKSEKRKILDKNSTIRKIELDCDIENKKS